MKQGEIIDFVDIRAAFKQTIAEICSNEIIGGIIQTYQNILRSALRGGQRIAF